jgi:hypothetical protein
MKKKLEAADLLLRMLRAGVAQWDSSTKEFRFDGIRYVTSGSGPDWIRLLDVVGWDKAQSSLSRAEGK